MTAGRPREFDVNTALYQAMLVFWKLGYRNASLEDLTKAMNINRPSLYAAFGDKPALFLASVERYVKDHAALAAEILDSESEIKSAIGQFLKTFAKQFTDPALPGGCMVSCHLSDKDLEENLRSRLIVLSQATEKLLANRLRRAAIEKQLRNEPSASELAAFFMCVLGGLSQAARTGASRQKLYQVIQCSLNSLPAIP